MSRVVRMQFLASIGWQLQLGDIKGAFMEAAAVPVSPVEETPAYHGLQFLRWSERCIDKMMRRKHGLLPLTRSKFDSCLCYLRDPSTNQLVGAMAVSCWWYCCWWSGRILWAHDCSIEKIISVLKMACWRRWSLWCHWQKMSQDLCHQQNRSSDRAIGENSPWDQRQGCLHSLSRILPCRPACLNKVFPGPKSNTWEMPKMLFVELNKIKIWRLPSGQSVPLTLCRHSDAAWANVGQRAQARHIVALTEKESRW